MRRRIQYQTHLGLKCWCAAAIARGTPSAGNVIVDGTDSVTQESCQSSTDSTDMSEEEEGSDTLPDQVSGETHIDETAQFALDWKEAAITRNVRKLCASASNFNCKKKT